VLSTLHMAVGPHTLHTVAQLYGLPHGILHVFNTILYENEIQNPQMFKQTISLFPEQSTLVPSVFRTCIVPSVPLEPV
jgi:hypothetical protein